MSSEVLHEDAYWAALCCQLEMIRAGTTCFIDPGSYFPEQTAKATGDSGMRGIVARTAIDIHQTSIGALPEKMFRETKDEAVARSEKAVRELNGLHEGRVRAWFRIKPETPATSDGGVLATAHQLPGPAGQNQQKLLG